MSLSFTYYDTLLSLGALSNVCSPRGEERVSLGRSVTLWLMSRGLSTISIVGHRTPAPCGCWVTDYSNYIISAQNAPHPSIELQVGHNLTWPTLGRTCRCFMCTHYTDCTAGGTWNLFLAATDSTHWRLNLLFQHAHSLREYGFYYIA